MGGEARDRIALLEARVTLLERRFRQPVPTRRRTDQICYGLGLVQCRPARAYHCDAYEIESDESGRPFRWLGRAEQVQFVFPHRPEGVESCRVRLLPPPSSGFRVAAGGGQRRGPGTCDRLGLPESYATEIPSPRVSFPKPQCTSPQCTRYSPGGDRREPRWPAVDSPLYGVELANA